MSDDAGATWKKVNERRDLRQRAFYYTRVYADPKVKDTVYVLNVNFYKSTDGGKTWKPITVPHGDNHDLWIAPNDSNRMIEANDGGAHRLGQRRRDVDAGDDADRAVLSRDHDQARAVSRLRRAAGQQHGVRVELSRRAAPADRAACRPVFYSVGGGESGYIASDPRNPDIFYAGSYGGLITRLDRRTGQERAINPYPDNPMGYASADITERFQWTFPIVLAPTDPGRSTSARSTSGSRPTKARAGRGSART